MSINYNSPTLAPPRISYARFLGLLKSKNSPAVPEAQRIWDQFIAEGVDPSFALAQYRVESQYGTAGHAEKTKSWGNMLYDSSLTILAAPNENVPTKTYSPGNGFTYAVYANHTTAAIDYARYLHNYAEERNLPDIYGATAEWIGRVPGSSGHTSYVNIVINDMYEYEISDGEFYEVGDKMIYAGAPFDKVTGKITQKYPVVDGKTVLYRGTDGTVLKTFSGKSGLAWFFGLVQGSKDWGLICIGTSIADSDATLCYIKNVDLTKVVNV